MSNDVIKTSCQETVLRVLQIFSHDTLFVLLELVGCDCGENISRDAITWKGCRSALIIIPSRIIFMQKSAKTSGSTREIDVMSFQKQMHKSTLLPPSERKDDTLRFPLVIEIMILKSIIIVQMLRRSAGGWRVQQQIRAALPKHCGLAHLSEDSVVYRRVWC